MFITGFRFLHLHPCDNEFAFRRAGQQLSARKKAFRTVNRSGMLFCGLTPQAGNKSIASTAAEKPADAAAAWNESDYILSYAWRSVGNAAQACLSSQKSLRAAAPEKPSKAGRGKSPAAAGNPSCQEPAGLIICLKGNICRLTGESPKGWQARISDQACCLVSVTDPPSAGPDERWCGRTEKSSLPPD